MSPNPGLLLGFEVPGNQTKDEKIVWWPRESGMRDKVGHPSVNRFYFSGFMRSDNELLSDCNVFAMSYQIAFFKCFVFY